MSVGNQLIDEFMPVYDVSKRHQILVHASIDDVFTAVQELDISDARLSKLLFRLRGLPSGARITMSDILRMGFVHLGERPNQELLLGLVGQFWKLSGNLQRLEPEAFKTFNEVGYAKTVWDFTLTETSEGTVLLETETRVACTDAASRRRFRFYWFFIGPFSGVIRKDALKAIKKKVEKHAW